MGSRIRGKWLLREQWFSICSNHRIYQQDCPRCNAGQWKNVLVSKISNICYKYYPRLWRRWVNRKGSNTRKFLESTFPRLKF